MARGDRCYILRFFFPITEAHKSGRLRGFGDVWQITDVASPRYSTLWNLEPSPTTSRARGAGCDEEWVK